MTNSTSKDELRDYILDLVDYREDRADSIMERIEVTSQRARLEDVLPDYEESGDYNHGSHAEGWNDCINEIKAALSKKGDR